MLTIRQGDVALVKVNSIPDGAIEVAPTEGRVVMAYGEQTGHAHAFYELDKVKQWSAQAERFIQIFSQPDKKIEAWKARDEISGNIAYIAGYLDPIQLLDSGWTLLAVEKVDGAIDVHEEHFHPVIFPGIYKLPQQMEYTPAELQRVAD